MAVIAGVLPVAAFLLFWAIALRVQQGDPLRPPRKPKTQMAMSAPHAQERWLPFADTFLRSAIVWGCCVVVFTEGLSLLHALTVGGLTVTWLLAIVSAIGALTVVPVRPIVQPSPWIDGQEAAPLPIASPKDDGAVWITSLALSVLILVVLAGISFLEPPNNWDAMAYHLARVQHWIQNQSVAFYPTNDPRQLFDPPWAEYAILQFQVLTGGDDLANFVQWFCDLGTGLAVLLIAQRLGANRAGQGLALIVALTTPMAILQASSPQNDLATSFWTLTFIYFTLLLLHQPSVSAACMAGGAVGLAVLTKGTAYVFVTPVLLTLGVWIGCRAFDGWRATRDARVATPARPGAPMRRDVERSVSWRGALRLVCLMGALALALNAGQWARNFAVFHSPLGPDGASYANQTFAPTALLCNAARDVSLELGASTLELNATLYHTVVTFCDALGVDANDPRITWQGVTGHIDFLINAFNTDQGSVGNPVQFVLIIGALVYALALRRFRADRRLIIYALSLVVGFGLFCGYIRWQPWGNRLLLPWFMAAAPLVGVVVTRFSLSRVAPLVIETVLLVSALPSVLLNDNAPLIGATTVFNTPRLNLYFITNTPIEQPYMDATAYLKARHCAAIGFHSVEGWEYPLWQMLGTRQRPGRIEEALVDNASQSTATQRDLAFHPCAIMDVLDHGRSPVASMTFHGTTYHLVWLEAPVALYRPGVTLAPPQP